jgi:eukaryotic-like serine/threonine-protein kinase
MALLSGTKLGAYEIRAALGAGGMGEVYRATDTKLGRDVALKVLPAEMAEDAERLARFRREAKVLAQLDHPNIVTIYSVEEAEGVHFLTMQLVEGLPLDRVIGQTGLPVEQIVEIAAGLTDALAAAHEKGIVHRDLKPANVMVTNEGRVKVLDFGLAKDVRGSGPGDATLTSDSGTQVGVVMGTPAYMSPEQTSGRPLDHRTDIFSLGVVLFEMSTGRRPFEGGSAAELVSAILRDTPPSVTDSRPDLPSDLARIVRRCLEKDPRHRMQTARDVSKELKAALAQSSRSAQSQQPSIAVLPFANMSRDADDEFFSEGLAEEILNALGHIEGLKVAARSSAFFFKGQKVDVCEIAAKLRVSTVLEGSVRRSGDRVRVIVQLVNAHNGFHLWSERYDRQMEDIFEVQDEIARAIAEKLKVTLAFPLQQPTQNVEAYELYLKGRHYWHQRSGASVRLAARCFEEAIKLDPTYAMAYAGLADCYTILRVYGFLRADEAQPPAQRALNQAVRLAPELWEVVFSRAFYRFYIERAWREAVGDFQKAVEINPRSSLARVYFGVSLANAGNREQALAESNQAKELDPLSPLVLALAGTGAFLLGLYEESVGDARRALKLQPDYVVGNGVCGMSLCGLGRFDEAIAPLERARAPLFTGVLGLAYARSGRVGDARQHLEDLDESARSGEYVPAFARLGVYVGLRDEASIRRELAKAMEEKVTATHLKLVCGRFLDEFRRDAEIDRMLNEIFR